MTKKILIVDDDPDDRRTMQIILEKKGYQTATAENGEKALELLAKKKFDLILLNIIMPGLSGLEVNTILKKRKVATKVIFVSIMPAKEVPKEEVDGFVQKPFSPDTLVSNVRKTLRTGRREGASI
jgi:DNA-binding NtrC family response regulator